MITIATSLAPNNFEIQKAAIESWKTLGFEVISLNSFEEIEKLKPNFNDVNFFTVDRNAKEKYGKPYIYFDDVLDFFRRSNNNICGIVNSDILLNNSQLIDVIEKEAINSLIYGSRVDVNSIENLNGTFLEVGFDYFFFDKSIISCYPREVFCLGQPWWDWWAVLMPIKNGTPIKKLLNPFAFHIKHKLNWDQDTWIDLGNIISNYLPYAEPITSKTIYDYAYSLFELIKESTNDVIFCEPSKENRSVLVVYNSKGANIKKSKTYQSIVAQTHQNYEVVIDNNDCNFNKQKDFLYFIDEGYYLNKNFFKLMLALIDNEDYAACGIKRLRNDNTVFLKEMYPIHNLDGNLHLYEYIKECVIYRTESFLENNKFNGGDFTNKKMKFVGWGLVERELNDIIRDKLYEKRNQKVYIYGAGSHTKQLIDNVKFDDINIYGIIDKNEQLEGQEIYGYRIINVNKLESLEIDYILISSETYEQQIYDQLRQIFDDQKLIRINYRDGIL